MFGRSHVLKLFTLSKKLTSLHTDITQPVGNYGTVINFIRTRFSLGTDIYHKFLHLGSKKSCDFETRNILITYFDLLSKCEKYL